MKIYRYSLIFVAFCTSLLFIQCEDADDNDNILLQETCDDEIQNGEETGIDCGGPNCVPCSETINFTGTYVQQDQMGRPGVSALFASFDFKDSLNVTVPSAMEDVFQERFKNRLMQLNPGYTTNILGQDSIAISRMFSRDVLWVAQIGETTYNNGTEILTGRRLTDDVIDFNLLLIYGGPTGTENDNDPVEEPLLIRDGVDSNDAVFSPSFPYVVAPFIE